MPFIDDNNKQVVASFLGSGILFPLQLDSKGKAVVTTGLPLVRSSIAQIFAWQVGTRFFLGEFGSRLEELIEEPNDDLLRNVLVHFIQDCIDKWEKRVVVRDVTLLNVTDTTVDIQVTVQLTNTQITDSFIYPYYRNLNY